MKTSGNKNDLALRLKDYQKIVNKSAESKTNSEKRSTTTRSQYEVHTLPVLNQMIKRRHISADNTSKITKKYLIGLLELDDNNNSNNNNTIIHNNINENNNISILHRQYDEDDDDDEDYVYEGSDDDDGDDVFDDDDSDDVFDDDDENYSDF